jgi:hypothetical protein
MKYTLGKRRYRNLFIYKSLGRNYYCFKIYDGFRCISAICELLSYRAPVYELKRFGLSLFFTTKFMSCYRMARTTKGSDVNKRLYSVM